LVGLAVLTVLLKSKIQQGLKLSKIFIFNKRPKGHIYQPKRPPKVKRPQVEHRWSRPCLKIS